MGTGSYAPGLFCCLQQEAPGSITAPPGEGQILKKTAPGRGVPIYTPAPWGRGTHLHTSVQRDTVKQISCLWHRISK